MTVTLSHLEQIEAARTARAEGMATAEAADHDGWDKLIIDQAIRAFAGTGRPFSANQLREVLPEVRSALIGSRFLAASLRGQIRKCGFETSTKKNTHGKPVARWINANRNGETQ